MPLTGQTNDDIKRAVSEALAGPHKENRRDYEDLKAEVSVISNRVGIVEIRIDGLRKDFDNMATTVNQLAGITNRFGKLVNMRRKAGMKLAKR